MGELLERHVEQLPRRVARDLAQRSVHLQQAPAPRAVDALQRHPDRRVLEGGPEPVLQIAQRALRDLALGDVAGDV